MISEAGKREAKSIIRQYEVVKARTVSSKKFTNTVTNPASISKKKKKISTA